MKKLLLSMAAALAVAGSMQAEKVTETITVDNFEGISGKTTYADKSYTSPTTGITYTANLAGGNNSIQLRSNNNNAGIVVSANPNNYKATEISVEFHSETVAARILNVYGKNDPYAAPTALYNEGTSGTLIGQIKKTGTAPVEFTEPMMFFGLRSSSGALYISQITITYEASEGPVKQAAGLSFPEASYTYTIGSDETFTAPELTKATTAEVVYSSSDTKVATVDAATGDVTIVGRGTTVIIAKCAENDEFLAGSASYTLTVTDPSIVVIYENTLMAEAEDFTFEGNESNIWKFNNYGLTATGYISGAATSSSAMAYPPVLDLTEYEAPITITFDQAINNFKKNNELIPVKEVANFCGVWAAGANSPWLSDELKMTLPETQSWTFVPTTINIDKYAGTKMKFAFWYQSNTSVAGTWEIKNLKIEGKKALPDAVETISSENEAPVFYDLQGRRVANPEKGLYIRLQGGEATKVML